MVHGCGLAAVVHCVECDMHGAASVGSGMFCAVHDMLEHLFELHTREMWVGNVRRQLTATDGVNSDMSIVARECSALVKQWFSSK